MKKTLIFINCIILALCSIMPINAKSENDFDINVIYEETKKISSIYNDAGITTGQLLEMMAVTPKEEQILTRSTNSYEAYFKSHPVKILNPSEYNLESTPQLLDGDMYDGNPPYTSDEQMNRMKYIQSILKRDYSASRYNQGLYATYLYTSHYIENVSYDRTQSDEKNFGYPVYAHIISASDIEAFDSFYDFTKKSVFLDSFTSFVDGIKGIYESNIQETKAKELLQSVSTEADTSLGEYLDELNALGIIDTENIFKTSKELYEAYILNINNSPNSEELINAMYQGLGGGLSEKTVRSYVKGVKALTVSLLATSLISPVLGGVIYYVDTLAKMIPTLGLAKLYYTGSLRRADRLSIFLGLYDKP